MKICPKCRKVNSDNSIRCENCGANLYVQKSYNDRIKGQNSYNDRIKGLNNYNDNKKGPNRTQTIILCVLAFLLIIILVIEVIILFPRDDDSNSGDNPKSEVSSNTDTGGNPKNGGDPTGANSTTGISGNVDPSVGSTKEPAANPATTMPPTGNIPNDAILIGGNYYKVYRLDEIDTWQKAKQYCVDQGGHLAVITSQELNDILYELCYTQGFETAFFGFSDADSEGKWLWVTQAQPAYRNWAASEPNAGSSGEDFAMFSTSEKNGKWNDSMFGYETTAFICQWGDAGIEDSEIEVKIPEDALVYDGHSYYVFDNGMTSWSEAEQYCRSLGGYMAIINNSEENETLYNYVREECGKKGAFFGYSDKEQEGTWVWYGDDQSTFEDWGIGGSGDQEPNQDHVYSDYAQFLKDIKNGHWNDDLFGNYTSAYICEWNTVNE